MRLIRSSNTVNNMTSFNDISSLLFLWLPSIVFVLVSFGWVLYVQRKRGIGLELEGLGIPVVQELSKENRNPIPHFQHVEWFKKYGNVYGVSIFSIWQIFKSMKYLRNLSPFCAKIVLINYCNYSIAKRYIFCVLI